MNKTKQNKILAEIVDVLRANGVKTDSAYDIKNFFEDYMNHSALFDCGKFENRKIKVAPCPKQPSQQNITA